VYSHIRDRIPHRSLHGAAALSVAALLALGATACGSSSSSSTAAAASSKASDAPFKVLAVMPMSGPLAAVGKAEGTGFQAAAKVINAKGGILGHRVTIKIVDDAGTGEKAVSAAMGEANNNAYNLISCGSFGDDAIPCSSALAANAALQIPLAAESHLNDPAKLPRVFVPGGLFDPAEQAMVAQMKSKGIAKFAIVQGDTVTGRLAAGILEKAAKQAGLSVTTTVFVPVGAVDATPQVLKAKASHPDAVAITGFTPANGPIIAARAKLGWNAPVYGDVYFSAANLAAIAKPKQLKGITLEAYPWMVKGNAATETPEFKAFWSTVLAMDPHPLLSDIAPLVSYQAVVLARAAAEKAKAIDGKALAAAMNNVSSSSQVPGFVGPPKLYTPNSHVFGTAPSDFTFVPAGPTVDGILVPG
jgi:branched-chain amino acid transport system substrate-binding protein